MKGEATMLVIPQQCYTCLKFLTFNAKVKSFDFQVRNDLYYEEALLLALELLRI